MSKDPRFPDPVEILSQESLEEFSSSDYLEEFIEGMESNFFED